MPSPSYRTPLLHLGSWAVFILYECSIIWVMGLLQYTWWEYLGYYFLNIGLFYLHAHGVLAHTIGKRRSPFLLLVLVPLQLGLYTVLEYALQDLYNLFRTVPKIMVWDLKTVAAYVWRGGYFIGLSSTYWFVLRMLQTRKQINQLEVERLQAAQERIALERDLALAQNAFLQAQINPHLLFNTLNFIYNGVQDTAPKAAEGVMLLSEVMHYALAPTHADGMTDLENEVEHIRKYVALNQLRFRLPLHLRTCFSGNTAGHRIPPLVLLTFVENTFQHGDLTDPTHPALVSVACHGQQMHFRIENKKRSQAANGGHGIGIQNARTRLREAYPGQVCSLDIREDDLHYAVDLQINTV